MWRDALSESRGRPGAGALRFGPTRIAYTAVVEDMNMTFVFVVQSLIGEPSQVRLEQMIQSMLDQ